MCRTCADVVRRHFPDIPVDKCVDFLFQVTAFPCTSVEHIVKQIEEMADKSGGDWELAMEIADEELDAAMTDFHIREQLCDLGSLRRER